MKPHHQQRRPVRVENICLDTVESKWLTMLARGELPGTALHHACYRILEHFFGEQWLRNHVLYGCDHQGFLSLRPDMDEQGIGIDKLHTQRVLHLAELLFNLQGTPGIEDCLDRIFTGQIESVIAELDFGMFMRRQGINFRYVVPSNVKMKDYDVELIYNDGTIACGDIKCKIEGSEFTPDSLLNSLKKARKQLPADRPGIVFVKVPQDWVNRMTGEFGVSLQVGETLDEFFKSTGRVVQVSFYTMLTIEIEEGTAVRHICFERENPLSSYASLRSWRLFDVVRQAPGWININAVLDTSRIQVLNGYSPGVA